MSLMREVLGEFGSRLGLAWAALLGHAILHGVTVENGTITTHRKHVSIGRDTHILNNAIRTPGPVVVRGNGTFTSNKGNALTAQALARQERDEIATVHQGDLC
jgi:hypothetical protein